MTFIGVLFFKYKNQILPKHFISIKTVAINKTFDKNLNFCKANPDDKVSHFPF